MRVRDAIQLTGSAPTLIAAQVAYVEGLYTYSPIEAAVTTRTSSPSPPARRRKRQADAAAVHNC